MSSDPFPEEFPDLEFAITSVIRDDGSMLVRVTCVGCGWNKAFTSPVPFAVLAVATARHELAQHGEQR